MLDSYRIGKTRNPPISIGRKIDQSYLVMTIVTLSDALREPSVAFNLST
jgi:hypothetical protein